MPVSFASTAVDRQQHRRLLYTLARFPGD